MKASLSKRAEEFRKRWSDGQIYQSINKELYRQETFTLHDGPPYANGDIHLGHALNKILKDFVLRYKALSGYKINYIPGWDTHGLPIENRLEREGQYKSKNLLEKRKACEKYALEQIERQKAQFQKLHLLYDFKEIYRTLDKDFINAELDIFYSFIEKKLLYWDLKPVAWSWSSKTALAESEIIYKSIKSTSIYFWFPLEENFKDIPKGTRFLIWTTTPYTIEANLALSVNPDFTYSLIHHEDHYWIVLSSMKMEGEIKKEFKGEYLEGAKYKNTLTEEINPVILSNHVTEDIGTGIVHTAPALGLEDYYACQKYNISPYACIKDDGYFSSNTKFPPINNLFYQDASKVVIEWLQKEGYLHKSEEITHNVGHDWRTEQPLLYRASPQWFIDISALKSKIKGVFKDIKSTPEWLSQKLENLILSRNEWCLSRQRAWGTPIPILFDDNKPILDLKQIKHTIELLKKNGVNSWYQNPPKDFLHPETKITGKLTASRDILDVWFDSGCSWNILKDKQSDLYLEGFDQLRGWFNSSATISIASQNKLPFKALLAHGFVLDGSGAKMSKSKGNVIDPIEIVDEYGADILRLWLATSNYLEDIRLSEISLQNTITLYRKIRNTLFRYSLSVLGDNFTPNPNKDILKNLKFPENRYIYQLFRNTYREMLKHLENYHFFKAINANITFLNTYSSWYLEICKDTLYCYKDSGEYHEIINIIAEIFKKCMIFYSIFIPQTAEEAHDYTNTDKSVFLEQLENLEGDDYPISDDWKKFFKLRDKIYALIEDLKNQKKVSGPQEVSLQLPDLMPGFDLKKYLNVAEISEGPEIEVKKCLLDKCKRCKRHNAEIKEDFLCQKCLSFLREIGK